MNFEDEAYVRLYTRRTTTNRLVGWEGRAVLHEMLYEFDRAGIFDFRGDLASCIAAITGLPTEVAVTGLARLLDTETWTVRGNRLVWPTYEHAQSCAKSDRLRQRESRKNRVNEVLSETTPAVTKRDEPSRPVTSGHVKPENVTPILAEPSLSEQSRADLSVAGTRAPQWWKYPEGWRWHDDTWQAAVALGVTAEQLQEHVDYWTTHEFARPTTNLDKDLVRCLPKIRAKAETDKAKQAIQSPPGRVFNRGASPVLEPTAKHVAYAKAKGVDLSAILTELNEIGAVESFGLMRAKEMIGERLSLAARAKAS